MRITNNIIQQTSVTNVRKNLKDIYRSQQEISTGRKLIKPSDDPLGGSVSMQTRTSLRSVEQYRRGIDIANSRATAEEAVLDQVTNVLTRAKELAIAMSNDTVNAEQRKTTAIELDELFKEVVNLANTRYGDGYLFGGTGPNTRPYEVVTSGLDLDFTTTSPSGSIQIAISDTNSVPANHNGVEVFEDTGAFASLRDMATALRQGDRDAIIAATDDIDTAFAGIQNVLGAVGSRVASLQITGANLDALKVGLEVLQSDVEDADMEKSITELMSRQTSYQAALMTTSRIVGMTLADYMR